MDGEDVRRADRRRRRTCSPTSTRRRCSRARPADRRAAARPGRASGSPRSARTACEIAGRDIDPIHVPVAREIQAVDPTGVGDGFRAGFFAALSWGLGLERAAQVGSLLATLVLETVGTQEYEVRRDLFVKRLAESYGDAAADEVRPHLVPCVTRRWSRRRAAGWSGHPRRPAVGGTARVGRTRHGSVAAADVEGGAVRAGDRAEELLAAHPAPGRDVDRPRPGRRRAPATTVPTGTLGQPPGQRDHRQRAALAAAVERSPSGAVTAPPPRPRRAARATIPGSTARNRSTSRLGRLPVQRDPHVAVGQHAHRLQHVARPQRRRRAGRAGRDGEARAGPARAAAPRRRRTGRRR